MLPITIRSESSEDIIAISDLITAAFKDDPMSDKREAEIVELMRKDRALTLSLVAEYEGKVIGHIAFSEVMISGESCFWYGLAPVAVAQGFQNKAVGSQLIKEGLAKLKEHQAKGCVVLGEPKYYGRFGFKTEANLKMAGLPEEYAAYFQALSFNDSLPNGDVKYHSAFYS